MATESVKLPAFVVDKKGLAKLLERKGKSFAVVELIQNAWDEHTSQVDVTLEREKGDVWKLVVEDDNPAGFKDLTHAYTLFAESLKKGDASKRGRFNLGEKLVIAVCEVAKIETTKGTVLFAGDHRKHSTKKREKGSMFTGLLRLTDDETKEIYSAVMSLLPPHGIVTTFNLAEVPHRLPLRSFEVSLRTEIADADGRLKPTTRKTWVQVFEPSPGEVPSIYELGIPVVETGDRWHVNVQQKVPLPTDRDNVPPGYLRDVRVAVLNACFDLLKGDDAKAAWVSNAMEGEKASVDAVGAAFRGKFGDKTVIFDPNDSEANKKAAAEGYVVVPGGSLPKAAWKHVKSAGIAEPAGQVTPSLSVQLESGDGPPLKLMDEAHWPEDVRNVVSFSADLARLVMGVDLSVTVGNDPMYPAGATYGRVSATKGALMLNLGRLGYKWFEQIGERVLDLLLDEFGHHFASDHLDSRYYKALRTLGAKFTMLALKDPAFFASYGVKVAVTA